MIRRDARRAEKRINLRVPVILEIEHQAGEAECFDSYTGNVSSNGALLELDPAATFSENICCGQAYQATIKFPKRKFSLTLAFVWLKEKRCGIRFLHRSEGWIVNGQ